MSEFLGWIKMPYSKSLGFKDLSLPIFFFQIPAYSRNLCHGYILSFLILLTFETERVCSENGTLCPYDS